MFRKKQPTVEDPDNLKIVLDDLCMRFLVNLPAVEYESFERLFFAIESAHWFYDDFYRAKDPSLPRLPLKQFAAKIFGHTDLLHAHKHDVDRLIAQFQAYKQEVPTCGAALLNSSMDRVVLVRAWGGNARWGFPKGKLSKDETELDCAIREVLEETGFDITSYVDDTTFYVETMSSGRCSRIYVVTDVPEHTVFETRTRKEISDIKWVPVVSLPENPKAAKVQHNVTLTSTGPNPITRSCNIFFSQYGIAPYTKKIRSWIKKRKQELHDSVGNGAASIAQLQNTPSPSVRPNHVIGSLPGDGAISVQELEASLLKSSMQYCAHRTLRSAASPSSRQGRKTKRHVEEAEESRNRTTFGEVGGARMNDLERADLFRQYVIETDRIAAEKGLCDDLWPVPYVTSKDFTAEQLRAAEEARKKREKQLLRKEDVVRAEKDIRANVGERIRMRIQLSKAKVTLQPETPPTPFVFDRDAVLGSMNIPSSS